MNTNDKPQGIKIEADAIPDELKERANTWTDYKTALHAAQNGRRDSHPGAASRTDGARW